MEFRDGDVFSLQQTFSSAEQLQDRAADVHTILLLFGYLHLGRAFEICHTGRLRWTDSQLGFGRLGRLLYQVTWGATEQQSGSAKMAGSETL